MFIHHILKLYCLKGEKRGGQALKILGFQKLDETDKMYQYI